MEATAYVNQGRWIVDCPKCNAGLFARAERIVCTAYSRDGTPIPGTGCDSELEVKFPDPAERAKAEAVLAEREELNRNWYPDRESVSDLKAENALRGVRF